jgi:hypothetical protein
MRERADLLDGAECFVAVKSGRKRKPQRGPERAPDIMFVRKKGSRCDRWPFPNAPYEF